MYGFTMTCNICKSKEVHSLYKVQNLNIMQCTECSHIFTEQSNTEANKEIYSENYFTNVHPNFFADCRKDYVNKIGKSSKLKNFINACKLIRIFKTKGKLLDIGCATGVFLDICRKKGFDVEGVEISRYAAEYARKNFKIKIYNTVLEKTNIKKNSFDAVTMLDLIEHVPDPYSIVKETHRILKKGGIIYILTTNEDSLIAKLADLIYKSSAGIINYPAKLIHPLHHIHHFSKKNLFRLLNENGFEIVYSKKSEMPIENIEAGFFIKSLARLLYLFSNLLNWQHEIVVIARKK